MPHLFTEMWDKRLKTFAFYSILGVYAYNKNNKNHPASYIFPRIKKTKKFNYSANIWDWWRHKVFYQFSIFDF